MCCFEICTPEGRRGIKILVEMLLLKLQAAAAGFDTGKGEKISNSQAQPSRQDMYYHFFILISS